MRKILLRQIDQALPPLQSEQASDSRIHDARKRIKMARATLRLLRKQLRKSQYRTENACLRDAARPLSEVRDAAVLLQTFNHLLKAAPVSTRTAGANRFCQRLAGDRSRSRRAIDSRNGLAHARKLLQGARSRAQHWHVGAKGWSIIGAGLKDVYGQGRQALQAVRSNPSDATFHEWRKQTKYLRHQVALLQAVRPREIEALAKALHRLSDFLGDDHDLAVLREKLTASRALFVDHTACERLRARIDRRRTTLQRKALQLGGRIYKEPPERFRTRLHRYWREWCGT
jgi:CHAD domain-containing protein